MKDKFDSIFNVDLNHDYDNIELESVDKNLEAYIDVDLNHDYDNIELESVDKNLEAYIDVDLNHDYDNIELESVDKNLEAYIDVDADFITSTDTYVSLSKDYNDLYNKPSINGITLIGDKSLQELLDIEAIDCGTSTTVI